MVQRDSVPRVIIHNPFVNIWTVFFFSLFVLFLTKIDMKVLISEDYGLFDMCDLLRVTKVYSSTFYSVTNTVSARTDSVIFSALLMGSNGLWLLDFRNRATKYQKFPYIKHSVCQCYYLLKRHSNFQTHPYWQNYG